MGCTCTYANLDNKQIYDEIDKNYNNDGSKSNLPPKDELIRITSMSRISSQRSMMLKSIKKQKVNKEPMKIGKLNIIIVIIYIN